MSEQAYTISEIREVVKEIAKKYGVKKVVLFGSYARGQANSKSDIDLLIEKGNIKGVFQLSGFRLDLEEKLKSPVDVWTTDSLCKDFLTLISREEIILHEQ